MLSGIIAGAGFISTGTIIQTGNSTQGLPTAASLWIVAAIGVAVGCGYYSGAVLTTVSVIVMLLAVTPLEKRIKSKISQQE